MTPALAALLLADRRDLPERDPPMMRGARAIYTRLLERFDRRPRLAMTLGLLVTLGGAAYAPFFGSAFLPELKEGHLILHMAAAPGTSLQESIRLGESESRKGSRRFLACAWSLSRSAS